MVTIGNFYTIEPQEFDEVWAITRKLKENPRGFKHVSDLSPSLELLNDYINLRDEGKWTEELFYSMYVPRFMKEIKNNPKVKELLNELCTRDLNGDNIALVCYCDVERDCHRSIIAGILQGMKANVVAGRDYNKYFRLYSGF